MDARRKVTAAGVAIVLGGAGLMAAHDLGQEAGLHFTDLAGRADVRVHGDFDAATVSTVTALPQVADVDCDDTLYGVTVTVHHEPRGEATVVTAAEHEQLRSFELRGGRMPAGAEEVLLDEATAAASGAQLGDRVVLTRQGQVVDGTLVGIAGRPGIRAVGNREPVAMLGTDGIALLQGAPACGLLLVRLHDDRDALDFADALRGALPGEFGVAFDNGVRHAI
ncbi:hypothetical protein [Dactylosporangium darangshiense]|uniref:DUF2993 domain-containing protein n=1 Tax=Dactylosporangium darangshiense TaxID=579108 RepID=A0ABP8DKC6_9ACTN